MLLAAEYGDTLYAVTEPGLGSGYFEQSGTIFSFSRNLSGFQGFGPYQLRYGGDQARFPEVPWTFDRRPVSVGVDVTSKAWEQPLYYYTEEGPTFSGYRRTVDYQHVSTFIRDPLSGDSLPYLVGGDIVRRAISKGEKWLAKKLGVQAICPICAPAVELAAVATAVNNSLSMRYHLQVQIIDKRAYLQPN
jgi:hypothetical protein